MRGSSEVTVVGGGVAGLVASIACAEGGAAVRLLEAHDTLGGRGRTTAPPYLANFGPHVLYANGTLHAFLRERDLLPQLATQSLFAGLSAPVVFHSGGRARSVPPLPFARAVVRLWRVREAPAAVDFRTWAAGLVGASAADQLSSSAGVFCFHHDPGSLSAAFVWSCWRQAFHALPSKARWVVGGWERTIERLAAGALERGVRIETGARVEQLPAGPVIVATELADAARLLGDEAIAWPSGATVTLDIGLRTRRGDPFVVWDLDDAGWVERFSAPDPTVAPPGEQLFQAQMPQRPGEAVEQTQARLEALLDHSLRDGWRERVTFRRRMVIAGRSGAADPPGTTWRDRPAVDRGDGRFLAGDAVAARGLLSDPAVTSAREAARGALAWVGAQPGLRAEISRL
ncbi:MAG TPA: NAD(P)-binding protein [Conexibacter sp.]|jgi:phytoene dehydrogenase-like protein